MGVGVGDEELAEPDSSGDNAIWGEPSGGGASCAGVDMSSERGFILVFGFNRSGDEPGEFAGGISCWGDHDHELVESE